MPEDEAAATLMELLDSPYVRWMIEEATKVSWEAWRALATNLHAACAGHHNLLEVAQAAWHEVSAADELRYRHGHAEKFVEPQALRAELERSQDGACRGQSEHEPELEPSIEQKCR